MVINTNPTLPGRIACQEMKSRDVPEGCTGHTTMIYSLPMISKAVVICIHYFNTRGELAAHNASGIAKFLQQVYGCPIENIVLLSDVYYRPTSQPTRRMILQSLLWLVSGCVPGDRLFFYSCGKLFTFISSYSNALISQGMASLTSLYSQSISERLDL